MFYEDFIHPLCEIKNNLEFYKVLISIIAIAVPFFCYYINKLDEKKIRKRFYWDFFISQYLDACFSFRGQKIELKDGRLEIELQYGKNWEKDKYEKFVSRSKIKTLYENKLAHRLSVVLNRIGQAAFVGDLPLEYIFPLSSEMILKDWVMVKALLEEIGEKDCNAIAYTRKFCRWIACVSCIYIIAHHVSKLDNYVKKYINTKKYIKRYIKDNSQIKEYITCFGKKIIKEIDALQKSDREILAKSTKKYIKKLKGNFRRKIFFIMLERNVWYYKLKLTKRKGKTIKRG